MGFTLTRRLLIYYEAIRMRLKGEIDERRSLKTRRETICKRSFLSPPSVYTTTSFIDRFHAK